MKLKALALIAALTCGSSHAQNIEVKDAWVRATVTGQRATGAFMKITAKDGAKLVGSASPAAGVTEVHEMKMDGGVMKMRAVEGGLDLPAGKPVELKPGGYHVMLMDLKGPVTVDSTVPLTLTFQDAKGVRNKLELKLPVRTKAPVAMAGEHQH